MRLALHALDVRQRLAGHCGQRQAWLCRLGAAQPAYRRLHTTSTPVAQTSWCTAPDVAPRPVPRSFATKKIFSVAPRATRRRARKRARRGAWRDIGGGGSGGSAGVGAVARRRHRRRRRRLSMSVDVDLRRIPAPATAPPPPPPPAAAAGAVRKSSGATSRRQPNVTPICRGRTSPQSARRGPAAPEEAVCTRAPAGGRRTEERRLARLCSTARKGTDHGTDAQSWACGESAVDVRLNDVPINKIERLF